MTTSTHHQQQGLSRIDVTVYVVIALLVMLGSLYAINRILHEDKLNQQISAVNNVFGKIKRQYQMQSDTKGVSVNSLAPLGVWPAERMRREGDQWMVSGVIKGSSEYLASNTETIQSISAHQGFLYTLHNLPKDFCAQTIKGLDKTVFAVFVANPKDYVAGATRPPGKVVKTNEDAEIAPDSLSQTCESISGNLVTITLVNRLTN